ncbi:MAG: Fic family protein, partial [Euryarchaeota archaeon]|nr:Fic family protein [Euryarchaeota archaeon]
PLHYVQNDRVIGLIRDIERADADLRHYETDPETRYRIFREALAQNAYGTASIEGNPLTLEEVESLLVKAPTPDNTIEPDEREILNFARFMEEIDRRPVPRTVDDIVTMHEQHFQGVLEKRGRLKERPNFIGRRADHKVVYVPSRPEEVPPELQAALDWLHEAPEHPLVKATVFFHEFQSIHPFPDGNGRLGRLLFMLYLYHEGYTGIRYAPIDYTVNRDRDDYWHMLDEGRRHDWDRTPWVQYNLTLLGEAYRTALDRFLFQRRLPATLNERQRRIAEWFATMNRGAPERRMKLADVHAAFPYAARRTLTKDLRVLVDAGVLEKEGELKGTRYRMTRTSP